MTPPHRWVDRRIPAFLNALLSALEDAWIRFVTTPRPRATLASSRLGSWYTRPGCEYIRFAPHRQRAVAHILIDRFRAIAAKLPKGKTAMGRSPALSNDCCTASNAAAMLRRYRPGLTGRSRCKPPPQPGHPPARPAPSMAPRSAAGRWARAARFVLQTCRGCLSAAAGGRVASSSAPPA